VWQPTTAWLIVIAVTSGSGDGLDIALISLAGALVGAVALIYTSRYKQKDPVPAQQAAPTDMSIMGWQSDQMSRRMDRFDDRLQRVEDRAERTADRVDRNDRRIDNLLDHTPEGQHPDGD
jgi:hypothetical protein